MPPLTGFPLKLGIGARGLKTRMMGYRIVEKFQDRFSRLDTITACDGRTDGLNLSNLNHLSTAKTALTHSVVRVKINALLKENVRSKVLKVTVALIFFTQNA